MEIPPGAWQLFKVSLTQGIMEADYLGEEIYAAVCHKKGLWNFYVGIKEKAICGLCNSPMETVRLPNYQVHQEGDKCIVTQGPRRTRRTSSGSRAADA